MKSFTTFHSSSRCLACGVAMLVAVPALAQPPGLPPPRVVVAAVRQEKLAEGHSFVGTVRPLRTSIVGSAVPGRVEQYLVNEGDRVKKGQPIAQLRIGIIEAEVAAAQAEQQVREAELEELENGARPDEIAHAKAALAGAKADLSFRMGNRERTRALKDAASREELEMNTMRAEQAEALYEQARATLQLLQDGPRKERIAQARAKLAVQKAEVLRLSEQLERHTMVAPFDGFVTAEHTEIGQWVMQGDEVAEIAELEEVDVEFPVLEDYIARLTEGAEAQVEIAAAGGKTFSGRVAIINPQADERGRTFPVKVRIPNVIDDRQVLLKAGMFARVTLPVGVATELLLAPKDAVVLGGATPVVFVVDDAKGKRTVRPVPVALGAGFGEWIEVRGELKKGQQVVIEGNERLRPGQEVRAEPRVASR